MKNLGVADVGGQGDPNVQHLGNLCYSKGYVNYGQLNTNYAGLLLFMIMKMQVNIWCLHIQEAQIMVKHSITLLFWQAMYCL